MAAVLAMLVFASLVTIIRVNLNLTYDLRTTNQNIDGFLQDEILFFTTGEGNRTLLEKRLPIYIRNQMSIPSKKFLQHFTTGTKTDYSQSSKSLILDKLMGKKSGGFFIECGALDGITQSNSVYFELVRNWSGLLVEGNLNLKSKLLNLGRNAFVLNSCLSTKTIPMLAKFKIQFAVGGLSDTLNEYAKNKFKNNQELLLSCFPFNSVLDAIDIRQVDLMTLDVEGSELAILKTVDFHRYKIDTLMIEFALYPSDISAKKSALRLAEYRTFFEELGLYKEMAITKSVESGALTDIIYQRKDYLNARVKSSEP